MISPRCRPLSLGLASFARGGPSLIFPRCRPLSFGLISVFHEGLQPVMVQVALRTVWHSHPVDTRLLIVAQRANHCRRNVGSLTLTAPNVRSKDGNPLLLGFIIVSRVHTAPSLVHE